MLLLNHFKQTAIIVNRFGRKGMQLDEFEFDKYVAKHETLPQSLFALVEVLLDLLNGSHMTYNGRNDLTAGMFRTLIGEQRVLAAEHTAVRIYAEQCRHVHVPGDDTHAQYGHYRVVGTFGESREFIHGQVRNWLDDDKRATFFASNEVREMRTRRFDLVMSLLNSPTRRLAFDEAMLLTRMGAAVRHYRMSHDEAIILTGVDPLKVTGLEHAMPGLRGVMKHVKQEKQQWVMPNVERTSFTFDELSCPWHLHSF